MLAARCDQPPQEANSWPLQVVPVHVPRQLQPSAGLPLQFFQPIEQLSITQAPLLHVSVPKYWQHLAPHEPQLSGSVWKSTQAPLQSVIPLGQEHVPLTHVPFVPQLCPHVAQLFGSVIKLTQPPLHSVIPAGQLDMHWPDEQTSPDGHALPQAPQFCGLLMTSTHWPEHSVIPDGHEVVSHLPLTHDWPLAQTVPHEPQCWGLSAVDTHAPEHIV
jgi:hypothetical protein